MKNLKTPEDEAFDDLARKQGMWGGGFQAKRQAAMDKINSHFDEAYKKMHEDRAKYGTSWSKDGERIDPMSVYLDEPAQEPVAWEQFYPDIGKPKLAYLPPTKSLENACYTAQPQRPWVGLTDEDVFAVIKKLQDMYHRPPIEIFARAIEQALKEKNA